MLIEPLTRAQCQTGYVFGSRFELEEDTIWVGLNSLAMGDLMFCEFAPGSHVGLLLSPPLQAPHHHVHPATMATAPFQ